MRRINEAGIALIKDFEALRLKAYRCPAGVWTIGWGHTGPDVDLGLEITEEEAEALLRADLAGAEACVIGCVDVPLTDNQFAALVSWVFNVGCGAARRSTLVARLNRGLYGEVPAQLRRWNKADGRVLPGLFARREAEAELWGTPNGEASV